MRKQSAQNVMAVFANPRGTDALRLGEEDKVLRECLRLAKHRHVRLEVRHAATIHDLRRLLLDESANVVHFSGHGTGMGLAFESEGGRVMLVPPDALGELLAAYVPPIHTVILNACYSDVHAEALRRVPYAIVMRQAVADDAAIEFTRGFYDAFASGRDIEFAFFEGIRTLKLMGMAGADIPQLFQSGEPIEQPRDQRATQSRTKPLQRVKRSEKSTPRLFAEFERKLSSSKAIVSYVYDGLRHYSIKLSVRHAPVDAVRATYHLHESFDPRIHEVSRAEGENFPDWIESFGDFRVKVRFYGGRGRLIGEIKDFVSEALRRRYGKDLDSSTARAIDTFSEN